MNTIDLKHFERLKKDREENANVLQKPALRGVWEGIINKYPESAHFIYELIQNADDACANRAEIHLGKDHLIFKHNGSVRFTISNVETEEEDRVNGKLGHLNAITSIGASTKENITSDNKIGKFGVGFKAVFQYTQAPTIYDDSFIFRIENTIVPVLLEKDHPLRKKGETLFYIPFNKKESSADKTRRTIHRRLSELNEPLLFLNHLEEIVWTEDGDPTKYQYKKKRISCTSIDDVTCELFQLSNANGSVKKIWLFSRDVNLKQGVFPISVGYYLDEKGNINTTIRPFVFCFFPTKEKMDLCCIMHAPFALVDSRQNIKKESETNDQLFKQLAELAADSLQCLKAIGVQQNSLLLTDNIFEIVLTEYEDWHYMDNEDDEENWKGYFYYAFKEALEKQPLYLTSEKKYVSASDAMWVVRPIRELLNRFQLNQLIAKYENPDVTQIPLRYHYVACSIAQTEKNVMQYLDELGIERFSLDDFGTFLTGAFMEKQNDEWQHKFIDFLCRDEAHKLIDVYKDGTRNVIGVLRNKPIIRSSSGVFVPPYKNGKLNVFLAEGISGANMNYADLALYGTDNGRKLLEKLNVKAPDKLSYIISFLIPKYAKANAVKTPISEVCADFKEIFSYYLQCPHSEANEFMALLKTNYCLKVEGTNELVFLGGNDIIYQNLPEIREYLSHSKYTGIVDFAFYRSLIESSHKEKLMAFFSELNLLNSIAIVSTDVSDRNYRKKLENELWKQTTFQRYTVENYTDYQLDDFDKWDGIPVPKKVSLCIWNSLLSIVDNLDSYSKILVEYSTVAYTRNMLLGESTMHKQLSRRKWIYNLEGKAQNPAALYIEDLDPMYTPNNNLFNWLGITSSPRIKDLELISQQCSEETKKDYELGMAARSMGFDSIEEMRQAKELLNKEKERLRQEKARRESKDNIGHHTQSNATAESMFCDVKPIKPTKYNDREILPEIEKAKIDAVLNAQQHQKDLEIIAKDDKAKYSYAWFNALLELEYLKSDEKSSSDKGLRITFGKICADPHSERCVLLKNPSRYIPRSLEEVGDLTVTFFVNGRKREKITFEVANVIDFTLRLKCKNEDREKIHSLIAIAPQVTRAELETSTSIKLISSLQDCYSDLGFEPNYSLKNNINPNIKFVFGPPGTGKTTFLVNNWIRQTANKKRAKMLILCPTNKAADVIAQKTINILSEEYPDLSLWMNRFVATADETLSEYVCSRESNFCLQEKCCVISTIARFSFDRFDCDYLKNIKWDYIVIDEASMIPLAEIMYPIYKCTDAQIIIAGDPLQIDPIVYEELWAFENIYTMIHLDNFKNPQTEPYRFEITNLSKQYRSVPSIGRLFSNYAYQGGVDSERSQTSQRKLSIDNIVLRSINFVHFPVEKYDSIYCPQRVANSNIQIYSVLFTKELVYYCCQQIEKNHPGEMWRIGVICPYRAEAELINKLWEQRQELFPNIDVLIGTVHGFQGDECDIVFAVYNPPFSGMKRAADRTFVNRKNILNVAISRAKEYLFILMPDKGYEDFENLVEARTVGKIALDNRKDMSYDISQNIEKVIFGDDNYLFNNTFVTNHQMGNVYTKPSSLYEIRIDENAVDIQVRED